LLLRAQNDCQEFRLVDSVVFVQIHEFEALVHVAIREELAAAFDDLLQRQPGLFARELAALVSVQFDEDLSDEGNVFVVLELVGHLHDEQPVEAAHQLEFVEGVQHLVIQLVRRKQLGVFDPGVGECVLRTVAALRVALQQFAQQVAAGRAGRLEQLGVGPFELASGEDVILVAEGQAGGHHYLEHHAQTPEVDLLVLLFFEHHLRSHLLLGPHHLVEELVFDPVARAEVGQLDVGDILAGLNQDVLGFDVAVDDAEVVQLDQA